MAKILLIVAIVVSAATAVLGFMNQGTLTETKETLAATEGQLASTKKSLADTTTKLKESEELATGLQADKDQLTATLSEKEAALAEAESSVTDLQGKITDNETTIAGLQQEIEDLKANGSGGPAEEGTVSTEDPRVPELEAMVAKLREENEAAKANLAQLQKKEEARSNKMMQKGIEGQVLAVNPAWNFVVLSIGDKQGVVNNAELLLKRGNQYLGKVRITSVEPQTSIADIVANTMPAGVSVQPGDSVIYTGSDE